MRCIRNTCLVDTPFALALYLLRMPLNEILRTKFITGGSIDKSITDLLPNKCISFPSYSIRDDWRQLLRLRLQKVLLFPSIYWSHLYAQDHLFISAQIIGRKRYTLIADAPNGYVAWEKCAYPPFNRPQGISLKQKIKIWLAFGGTMYNHKFGTNRQCVNRWVTSKEDMASSYIRQKNHEYIDAQQLWEQSEENKQKFILHIFGINDAELQLWKEAETLILTQPFREDCGLTDEEYIRIYKPCIQGHSNVIIKPHPRDKFDFDKYFPDVPVMRTLAPMQILNYIGINPRKAVTVCSTSISAMPDTVEKIMIGSKVNQKIFNTYGDIGNSSNG